MGNDQHVVADGTDFGQNMGTEDNGVFLFQAFDQITDLVDLFRIKADGWLIQNDELGIAAQCPGYGDQLLLTATDGVRRLVHEVGGKFYAFCEKKGFKTLGLWASGFKQITTRGKPVNAPEDLKGMKIRVMPSPQLVEQYKSWGANPIPIEYAELYNALQQNIVDGQENPLQTIAMAKLYEVQDYLTLSDHGFLGYLFIVNSRWFAKQSEDVRKLIVECEAGAREAERAAQAEGEAKFLEQIKQSKIAVGELTDENRAKFIAVSKPLHDKFVEGSATKTELLKAVYAAK